MTHQNEAIEKAILNSHLNNYESVKDFLGFNYSVINDNFLIESSSKKALEDAQESSQDFTNPINQKNNKFTLEINPGNFLVSAYFLANTFALTSDDCASTMMENQSDPTYRNWAINLGSFFASFEKLNDIIEAHPLMSDDVLSATQTLYQTAGMIGMYGEPVQSNSNNYKL